MCVEAVATSQAQRSHAWVAVRPGFEYGVGMSSTLRRREVPVAAPGCSHEGPLLCGRTSSRSSRAGIYGRLRCARPGLRGLLPMSESTSPQVS